MSHPPLVHTLVLPLGDPRAADPAIVGPKAAHLSSLVQLDGDRGTVRIIEEA